MSFEDFSPPKAVIRARFYVEAQHNGAKSDVAGHAVYDDVEMVEMVIPGDQRTVVAERVKAHHKERWPNEYRAFKEDREAPVEGTPLEAWAYLSPAQVATFKAINLRTVEDIAGCSDGHLNNLGLGGRDIRERARQFIKTQEGVAPLAELQTKVERLQAQAQVDQQTITDLKAHIERLMKKEDALV